MTDLERKLAALAAINGADCPAHDRHQVTIVIRGPIWEVVVGNYSGDGHSLEEAVNEAVETLERTTRGRCVRLLEATRALQNIRTGAEEEK